MVHEIKGNVFDFDAWDEQSTRVVIHCCNDIKAWGSGFVIAINEELGEEPKNAYLAGTSELGTITHHYFQEDNIMVYNIIGQCGIRSIYNPIPIDYAAIREGCNRVFKDASDKFGDHWEVHMPFMGSDRAGGNWEYIKQIVDDEIASRGIPVFAYKFEE